MIPSRLVFLRDTGEQDLVESEPTYGLAETPPLAGSRFVMTTKKGQVVKTGIVEHIEWLGKTQETEYLFRDPRPGRRPRMQKAYRIVGVEDRNECLFYTGHSIYRWARYEDGS